MQLKNVIIATSAGLAGLVAAAAIGAQLYTPNRPFCAPRDNNPAGYVVDAGSIAERAIAGDVGVKENYRQNKRFNGVTIEGMGTFTVDLECYRYPPAALTAGDPYVRDSMNIRLWPEKNGETDFSTEWRFWDNDFNGTLDYMSLPSEHPPELINPEGKRRPGDEVIETPESIARGNDLYDHVAQELRNKGLHNPMPRKFVSETHTLIHEEYKN